MNKITLDIPKLRAKKSATWNFYPSDTEELYEKNIKRPGWKWKDVSITYDFNDCGFRMKPFEDIGDDYILFLGCSNTVGIGLPLEETYPYKICDALGVDCVNLGISGGSNDMVWFLLQQLFVFNNTKPKYVVVNWTDVSRAAYYVNGEYKTYMGFHAENTEFYRKFLLTSDKFKRQYFETIQKTVELVCSVNNIPLYQFSFFKSVKFKNVELVPIIDFARDERHPGITSNQLVTTKLLNMAGPLGRS